MQNIDGRSVSSCIFACHAVDYAEQGLFVFPVGGKTGKKPLVKNWRNFGVNTWESLPDKFANQNIGFQNGKGKNPVTIVDIDDGDLFHEALEKFGDTPIKVCTPSGGYHFWYRYKGEKRQVRYQGRKIDILGKGGLAVAPPSYTANKGQYRFIEGNVTEISNLPPMTLKVPLEQPKTIASNLGHRNVDLYKFCLQNARLVKGEEELIEKAQSCNSSFKPPLRNDEVLGVVHSAWKCQIEGRNMMGSQSAIIQDEIFTKLVGQDTAFYLMSFLLKTHNGIRERFYIDQVKVGGLLGGKQAKTVRKAIGVLLQNKLIVKKGKVGKAILYGFNR
jgi:hypothetical protein